MLGIEELEIVLDKITEKVILANRTGDLDKLLESWNLKELLSKPNTLETYKEGKIVILGESEIKANHIEGIIKSLDIDKRRVEISLGYDNAKSYNYKKLRYNPNYRLVIFGAVPHSSTGKNKNGSVISEMQNEEGYPRVEVLSSNKSLKITKTNLKELLEKLKKEGYI